MFHNLIESGSHRKEFARRGRFLFGTLATYALLVALLSVASVFAYTAHLDGQSYEVTMLPPWTPPATAHAQPADTHPAPRHAGATNQLPERAAAYADLHTTTPSPPQTISTAPSHVVPLPPGGALITGRNIDPPDAGIVGPEGDNTVGRGSAQPNVRAPVNVVEDIPPPATPTPRPTPPKPLVLSQLIASKIVSKPVPPYPVIARAARVQGTVTVEILVDEQGRVVSATATSGPAMLREAARQAATLARFTPTQLNGQPVKVSGVISYNFVLQ
jgi:protein TonB